jgi:hypothetical protein
MVTPCARAGGRCASWSRAHGALKRRSIYVEIHFWVICYYQINIIQCPWMMTLVSLWSHVRAFTRCARMRLRGLENANLGMYSWNAMFLIYAITRMRYRGTPIKKIFLSSKNPGKVSAKTFVWETDENPLNKRRCNAPILLHFNFTCSARDFVFASAPYLSLLKRGSVQPGCILGGLRFRRTAIRIFKFVWCF